MIELEIVTPQRALLKTTCEAVTLPGVEGEFQVIEGHVPLLSELQAGVLSYDNERLMVADGFAEIEATRVTVLCDHAAFPGEVDLESEKSLIEQLQQQLLQISAEDDKDLRAVRAQIASAAAKIQVV